MNKSYSFVLTVTPFVGIPRCVFKKNHAQPWRSVQTDADSSVSRCLTLVRSTKPPPALLHRRLMDKNTQQISLSLSIETQGQLPASLFVNTGNAQTKTRGYTHALLHKHTQKHTRAATATTPTGASCCCPRGMWWTCTFGNELLFRLLGGWGRKFFFSLDPLGKLTQTCCGTSAERTRYCYLLPLADCAS